MAKKTEDPIGLIKDYRKRGKLVFGTRQTLQLMRDGTAEKVYIASNCPDDVREEVEHYGQLSGTEVRVLGMPSDELGVLCRRQRTVLVLGLLKE